MIKSIAISNLHQELRINDFFRIEITSFYLLSYPLSNMYSKNRL